MFKRIHPVTDPVSIRFDGREIIAQRGDCVAAALLADGVIAFRTSPLSGAPRGPLCMIGNCFECLVEIDGEPNQQACRVSVREGMQVRTQRGMRGAGQGDDA